MPFMRDRVDAFELQRKRFLDEDTDALDEELGISNRGVRESPK